MSEKVIEISDSSFQEEVVNSSVPVMVDFWAPWCGPCKSISPVLDELAETYAGKLKIAKMSIDDNPKTPTQYNVRSIPNLLFFKEGSVVDQVVGAGKKEELIKRIEKLLQ